MIFSCISKTKLFTCCVCSVWFFTALRSLHIITRKGCRPALQHNGRDAGKPGSEVHPLFDLSPDLRTMEAILCTFLMMPLKLQTLHLKLLVWLVGYYLHFLVTVFLDRISYMLCWPQTCCNAEASIKFQTLLGCSTIPGSVSHVRSHCLTQGHETLRLHFRYEHILLHVGLQSVLC